MHLHNHILIHIFTFKGTKIKILNTYLDLLNLNLIQIMYIFSSHE